MSDTRITNQHQDCINCKFYDDMNPYGIGFCHLSEHTVHTSDRACHKYTSPAHE